MRTTASGLALLLATAAAAEAPAASEIQPRRKAKNAKKNLESTHTVTYDACHVLKRGDWTDKEAEASMEGCFVTKEGSTEGDVMSPDPSWIKAADWPCARICNDPNELKEICTKKKEGEEKCGPRCVFGDDTRMAGCCVYDDCLDGVTPGPTSTASTEAPKVSNGQTKKAEKAEGTTAATDQAKKQEETEATHVDEGPLVTLCHVEELPNGKQKFKTLVATQAEHEARGTWRSSYAWSCEDCCDDTDGMLIDLCPGYLDLEEPCKPRCVSDDDEDPDGGYMKCRYDLECPKSAKEVGDNIILDVDPEHDIAKADSSTLSTKKVCYHDLVGDFMFTVYVSVDAPVDGSCNGMVGSCTVDGGCEGYCEDSDALNRVLCTDSSDQYECQYLHDVTSEGFKHFRCNNENEG